MNETNRYTSIDFEILEFISSKGSVHLNEILKKFPSKKYATEQRLNVLGRHQIGDVGFIKNDYIEDNEAYLYGFKKPTDTISITEKGLILLSDYRIQQSEESKKIFKTSFFYPFLVSIFTALFTTAITNYIIKTFNLFD